MSRLAERLKELLNARGLTQAEVVRRSEGIDKYVSKGTVSTYLSNPPLKPKRQVIEAFAEILDVPVSDLEEAATFTGREPFTPDPSADRLTPPQRAVLNELIRVMTDANEKAGEGNADSSPSMKQAGGKPATPDFYGLAADDSASEGRRMADEADKLGEGSQDTEGIGDQLE